MRTINKKKVLRILILIVLLIISIFVTVQVKNQFPSITIIPQGGGFYRGDNISNGNFTVFSPEKSILHYYCDEKYDDSILSSHVYSFNNNYIKEGDEILVQVKLEITPQKPNAENIKQELFAGTSQNNLKKLKKGINNIDLIYFNNKNVTVYILSCDVFNNSSSDNFIGIIPQFKRPSFVDSKAVLFIVFIGSFFLLEQFLSIILKWVFGKHPFID